MSTIYLYPASGGDDGVWNAPSTFTPSSSNISVGDDSSNYQQLFVRFPNVPLVQGTNISSGTIKFRAGSTLAGVKKAYIRGVLQPKASGPSSYTDINTRPLTSASGTWAIPATTINTDYSTPSIVGVLNEIFAQSSWSSGNALMITIRPSGALAGTIKEFRGYDFGANYPELSLEYTSPHSGVMTLYISTACAAGMKASGDMNLYPSGHWINSTGQSGVFWSYVNTNPEWTLEDNDFIQVVQSGHLNTTRNIWYNVNQFVKYYDTTLASGGNYCIGGAFAHNKEGWMYVHDGAEISLIRDNIRHNLATGESGYKSVVSLSNLGMVNVFDIVVDQKFKKLYITGLSTSTSYILKRCNLDGTSITSTIITIDGRERRRPFALDLDYQFNKCYVCSYRGSTFDSIISVLDLRDGSYCDNYISNQYNVKSISHDSLRKKLYLAGGNTVVSTGSNTNIYNNASGCDLNVAPSGLLSNILPSYLQADEHNQLIYFGSGWNLCRSNLDGLSQTLLKTEYPYTVTNVDLDGPRYTGHVDFDIEDLPAGFTTGNDAQIVTNAYVTIKGKEEFDFTNVYAKVLTRDKRSVIWENWPESCAQFSVTSGIQTLNIGLTGSRISNNYNTTQFWNEGVLRLETYSLNDNAPSGNFKIYSVQLNAFCSGDLITGTGVASGIPLYLHAATAYSGGITLYVPGQVHVSGLPLYVGGYFPASGQITLYTNGSYASAMLPLFISGPIITSGIDTIPLFTYSTSNSGQWNGITLFTKANQKPYSTLPLYLFNADGAQASGSLPLYITSYYAESSAHLPLYLENLYAASGLKLYIKGIGYNNNPDPNSFAGYPTFGAMTLFINRPNEVGTMSLYVHNSISFEAMDLTTFGASASSGNMTLAIPNTFASGTSTLNLFTSGW